MILHDGILLNKSTSYRGYRGQLLSSVPIYPLFYRVVLLPHRCTQRIRQHKQILIFLCKILQSYFLMRDTIQNANPLSL